MLNFKLSTNKSSAHISTRLNMTTRVGHSELVEARGLRFFASCLSPVIRPLSPVASRTSATHHLSSIIRHLSSVIIALYLGLCTNYSRAQQDAMFSQYMVNPFVLNPAYAGSRNAISTLIINRNQWLNIPGAPQTSSLSVNTPLSRTTGAGLQVVSDKIGPRNTIACLASYSYKIPFENSTLALGLRAGTFFYNFNWGAIDYKETDDSFNTGQTSNGVAINSDFGMFYYTKKGYLGISANHIAARLKVTEVTLQGASAFLKTHVFTNAGYTFEVSKTFAIQPSTLIKFVENAPVNADINVNFLFNKKLWLGTSFRPGSSIVFLLQAYLTDKLRTGYSYDMGINRIGRLGGGAHEIFIGYDFSRKGFKTIHPRYF